MGVGQLVSRVLRRQAEGVIAVAVPTVGEVTPGGSRAAFVANEVYLEVRIRQMWLTEERQLWREYLPFATVVTEFINQGRRVAVPSVLGSAALSRRFQVSNADDAIEIRNVRVAGPVPYEGDDVSLLIALFRLKTADWLMPSLKLIEEIAGVLGFAGLTAAAPVAETLIRGVESFLGAGDLELRVGAYQSWTAPNFSGEPAPVTELAPMNFVIIRRPEASMLPDELAGLCVKDGRLHRIRDGNLTAYQEHDFILVGVDARPFRDDYRQLEFYRLWEQTRQHIVNGDLRAARRLWRQTAGAIFTDELTRPQQEVLFAEYERRYADLVDRFGRTGAVFRDPAPTSGRSAFDSDDDPEAILRGAADV